MSLLTQGPGATPEAHTHSAATLVPDQSRGERSTSFDPADFPVPHGREEEWRFTPLRTITPLLTPEETAGRGRLDVDTTLPAGVTEATLTLEEARRLVPAPADRPAALAHARSEGAVHYAVPADTVVPTPLVVRLSGTGQTAFGHLVVTVGRFSKVTVVLAHSGRAHYSELVSVIAEDGADVTVVTLQEWGDDALHLAEHDIVVGRDASVRHIAVTLGGELVRVCTNATYAGPGGSFEGLGVYFADAHQHLEHRLFVDHAAPHCRSNVEYKGALRGETAHTVWVGDVLIRAAAEGTDTYELNRNLLLSDGARADSVPNLEIETGEIAGAGHASATGRFDDQQLFYLMTRGIDESEARRLVVRGFFASVLQRIRIPDVQAHLMEAVDRELAAAAQPRPVTTPAFAETEKETTR